MAKFPVEFPMVLPTGHLQCLCFYVIHFNTYRGMNNCAFLDSRVDDSSLAEFVQTSWYWTERKKQTCCKDDYFCNWSLQTRSCVRSAFFLGREKVSEPRKSFLTHSSDVSAPTQTQLSYCQVITVIVSGGWELLWGLTSNLNQKKIPTGSWWISRCCSKYAIKAFKWYQTIQMAGWPLPKLSCTSSLRPWHP